MTWKHEGKTDAFKYLPLNDKTAQEHNLHCDKNALMGVNASISGQAAKMLASLNDFDQQKVLNEIKHISKYPHSISSVKHSLLPFKRLWRSKNQFQSYHYLIRYEIGAAGIKVFDIYFDESLHGVRSNKSHERNMMYHIKRTPGREKFTGILENKELPKAISSWRLADPVPQIKTIHASVNGMQNELSKATWLMGAHLDVGYPQDNFDSYTLFHNPTDRVLYDAVECLFDKRKGTKSQNAQHLAAVLHQRQMQGQKTKWLVHSQGAIIFCAALEEYQQFYSGKLTHHKMVVHAPGTNMLRLESLANALRVKIVRENSSPFDPVPNLAGGNDLSPSSLTRSLKFLGLTFFGNELTSSHTLPYLGLESYHAQLRLAGKHRQAQTVLNYIEKNT